MVEIIFFIIYIWTYLFLPWQYYGILIDHNEKDGGHFTRMHCSQKSFKKANGRLLKAGIQQEVNFSEISHHYRLFRVIFIQSFSLVAFNALW